MPLHADDVLLVVNTVTSSAAFREDESWLPLCLPRFNPKGFLYAHVSFVAPEVCLVLLTAQADGFPQLSACRQQLAAKLQQDPPQLPSLFFSASCAEFYWDDLLTYLAAHVQVAEGRSELPDLR